MIVDELPDYWEDVEHYILSKNDSYEEALLQVVVHKNNNSNKEDKVSGIDKLEQAGP